MSSVDWTWEVLIFKELVRNDIVRIEPDYLGTGRLMGVAGTMGRASSIGEDLFVRRLVRVEIFGWAVNYLRAGGLLIGERGL